MSERMFLKTEDAANMLNMNKRVLEQWRWYGKGPKYYRIGSCSIRYDKADIERFIERGAAIEK